MPNVPFVAHWRDGAWRARVWPRHQFDLDQAARALAQMPPTRRTSRFGARTAQVLMHQAVEAGLTGDETVNRMSGRKRTPVDPTLVDRMRAKLVELGIFPDPTLDLGPDDWTPSPSLPIKARWMFGKWVLSLYGQQDYTLGEAARALAAVTSPSGRFGRSTAQAKLHEAASLGITGRSTTPPKLGEAPDVQAVAFFRDALVNLGIFTAEAAGTGADEVEPISA